MVGVGGCDFNLGVLFGENVYLFDWCFVFCVVVGFVEVVVVIVDFVYVVYYKKLVVFWSGDCSCVEVVECFVCVL